MEKARSMLSDVVLGQELVEEVVDIECYLVNRSPSLVLYDSTPHDIWTSKKPSLKNLKKFGCDVYVNIPNENRSKLDKKDEMIIFIGYKDGLQYNKL